MRDIVPKNTRYTPLTQQKSCCVPTCFQMLMLRNNIPLRPAEEIGYHLGLIVPPDRKYLFYNVRTAKTPPPAGYGTRIYDKEFEPNTAFRKLGIPFKMEVKKISTIKTCEALVELLTSVEESNKDALLCFNHGHLVDNPEYNWGHVCVFDRVINGQEIRIIDPSPSQPKWRTVSAEKMCQSMIKHGVSNAAGVWLVERTS